MDKINICFLGNWSLGANILESLLENISIGTVISTVSDDKYSKSVRDIAIYNNIEFYDTNSSNWRDVLLNNRYDLIISVSFGYILKKELYSKCRYGAINLHQSILPKYRGKDPITNAIINGENRVGFTIHYIDDGVDTGNIIFQSSWPLSLNDTIETINEKISIFSKNILFDVIKKVIIEDKSNGYLQEGLPSFAPKIDNIDWKMRVKDIRSQLNER